MTMIGTLINIVAVLLGGTIGLLFGAHLPKRVNQTVVAGIGLFTAAIGVQLFTRTENPIVILGSLLLGGLLGEWWRIESRLQGIGGWLELHFAKGSNRGGVTIEGENRDRAGLGTSSPFNKGFLTASLVFCMGPLTILGSIQDGLTGDYSFLAIKSVLDGFAGLAFAATLGVGVLFSTLVILVYQGGLSLLASQAQAVITPEMINEMTAVGGVLLLGLAVSSLLELKPIRVGNFLPALLIAPVIMGILGAVGVGR